MPLKLAGPAKGGMTVNVALLTSEALILGCDSTASTGDYYINPFAVGIEKDSAGKFVVDAQGRYSIKFKYGDLAHITTDAWGGVTKMFPLSGQYCHVAAITSGAANLNNRSTAVLSSEFLAAQKKKPPQSRPKTVKAVATQFLAFMRAEHHKHYKSSTLPPNLQDGPEFLLGGFGSRDKFPSLFRIQVKENKIDEEFSPGEGGISWNAQSDTVERVVRGYDKKLRIEIENGFDQAVKAYQADMNAAALRIVSDVLSKLNATMPSGVDTTLPSPGPITMSWDDLRLPIPYSSLPLQEAVNFVSYLIFMQAGKSRFVRGVATVGGRTHIGVITKDKGFRQLNEPDLTHRFTGFADDY